MRARQYYPMKTSMEIPHWSRTLRMRLAMMYATFTSLLLAVLIGLATAGGYLGLGQFAEDIMDQALMDAMPGHASTIGSLLRTDPDVARAQLTQLNAMPDAPRRMVAQHLSLLDRNGEPVPGLNAAVPTALRFEDDGRYRWAPDIYATLNHPTAPLMSHTKVDGPNSRNFVYRWVRRMPNTSAPPVYVQYAGTRKFEARTVITGPDGSELGQLQLRAEVIDVMPLIGGVALILWLGLSLIALLLGLIFGGWAARALRTRLAAIAWATDGWAQARFDTRIKDGGRDEIGVLARRLNHMADEWQLLLESRRALIVTEERNRVARDLHDSVKQHLYAASMQIGAVNAALGVEAVSPRTLLKEARDMLQLAYDELTGLIGALRPAALSDRGLGAALRELAVTQQRRGGPQLTCTIRGDRALPLAVEHALYRVAQEALANTIRHSGAANVQLGLICTSTQARLTITDDGTGFDPATSQFGVGLASMRERLAEVGGTLEIDASPAGTHVVANVPLMHTEESNHAPTVP